MSSRSAWRAVLVERERARASRCEKPRSQHPARKAQAKSNSTHSACRPWRGVWWAVRHAPATLRIPLCRGEFRASETRKAHAQTYTEREKKRSVARNILRALRRSLMALVGQNGVAGAAANARADRPSCPNEAAPRLRRHSRLDCRFAVPSRLAATRSSSDRREKSTESSRTAPQPAAGLPARPSLIVAMAPVVLAAWCCSETNAGEG